jgi:DNA-3-methyladenine glycosylase II
MNQIDFSQALKSLSKDPVMAYLAEQFGHEINLSDRYETDHAKALALLVVEQQVSFKAAQTIKARFLTLIDGLNHSQILALDHDLVQGVGLSNRKVEYIKNIYAHFSEKPRDYRSKTAEEIYRSLIDIKGVGRWTIEMFLIFVMGAPDIFSKGDLALINSIKKNYAMDPLSDQDLDRLIERWRPFNTAASLLLWCSIEQKNFYSPGK